jgi:GTPase
MLCWRLQVFCLQSILFHKVAAARQVNLEDFLKQELKGNLTGIRATILAEITELYEHTVDKTQLASQDLLNTLAFLTGEIGREIAVYINRRGQVVQVAVGDHATVSLPEVKGRKDISRLSGIRCIHTHPESPATLSTLDLTSLASLKLDCMAALEVNQGCPGLINVAYLQPTNGALGKDVTVFELAYSNCEEHPFLSIAMLIDKQAGSSIMTNDKEEDRALLVALDRSEDGWTTEDSLAELAELSRTAGAIILDSASQKRTKPDPATFIGHGKAQELSRLAQECGATCLIFDDELSPAQTRNLEVLVGCKILDRTTLILDIFAGRAKTREGKIQVELAQLKYLLPRLTGLGTVLSRLGGGIGTRGPGETKLETDRRHIRKRIVELEAELEGVKKHRSLQRTKRQEIPVVALVGYTNAGKSTLLNKLTDSDVLAEDKLFATLDPVTRKMRLNGNREILLTDTVGFVRKLPHHLVAAFRATLEEVVQADLLLHVVDSSHTGMAEQMKAVEKVLADLGAGDKSTLIAFNKLDLAEETEEFQTIYRQYPHTVKISAITGMGLDGLGEHLNLMLPSLLEVRVLIPFDRGDLLSLVHQEGDVVELEYLAEGVSVRAQVNPRLAGLLKQYTTC